MHCTTDKSPLYKFKGILHEWRAWDGIDIMEKHQLIRDYLVDLYKKALQRHPDLHSENILTKLLTLGDTTLCARMAVFVTNNNEYRQILARRGPAAQALLNLLQARLNLPIDSAYKHRHLNALIKLSRASGLYPECFVLKAIKIDRVPVTYGGFADIYKGDLLGQEIGIKQLKVYQKSDMDELFKALSTEAVTWRQLSHPNVLPFYGVFLPDSDVPRLCLVSPWMAMGNVVQFLADCTSEVDCVPLCLDIANGLEYLHNEKIIHGDLKGLNILVSRSHRAFIADFGVATTIHSAATVTFKTTTQRPGTLRWMAPERWPNMNMNDADNADTQRHNTQASDIYAFALVCYEMFSGMFPFIQMQHDFQVMLAVQSGVRPLRPSTKLSQIRGLTDGMWHIIEACWVQEPSQRPTASRIAEQLRSLPDQPMDERPLDDFNISFPSQVLQRQLNLPFATLTTSIGKQE